MPVCAETEHSWTVDFAERKRRAAEEAAPHRRQADTQRERAASPREQIKAHRKAGEAVQSEALLPEVDAAEKHAREAIGKAQAIEDAVHDLINTPSRHISRTRCGGGRESPLNVKVASATLEAPLYRKRGVGG